MLVELGVSLWMSYRLSILIHWVTIRLSTSSVAAVVLEISTADCLVAGFVDLVSVGAGLAAAALVFAAAHIDPP